MSRELQLLVYTSPQEGRNEVYSGKGARGLMLQGGIFMRGRARYHRIQLIAYNMVDAPLWSLPLIGPSPTPMTGSITSQQARYSPVAAKAASLYPTRLLRRVQLIPVDD